jgi:H+/Cl- antiporter ClcA
MQPVSQTPMESHTGDLLIVGIVFIIIGMIYILPSIVAFHRYHPNRWLILVINFAFGGTIIGWGIALAWAMRAVHRLGSTSSGGESGLNLFVNDVKTIQVVEPPMPRTSITLELERLHGLLARGVISQIEFDSLRDKLIRDAL